MIAMQKTLQLRKITISGFKSISSDKPLSIEPGNVTVLLGANGSGKSNVISFFKMLNFIMSGSFQLFVAKAGTAQVFLNYGSKHTSAIKGEIYFESDSHFDEYTLLLTHASPDKLIINSEELIWGKKCENNPQKILLPSEFTESALINSQNSTIKTIHRILSNCKVYQFHNSSTESPIRQPSPVGFADYLQSEGNNLAAFLYRLKNDYPDNYRKIVSYVRLVVPQFNDFYLEPNEGGYVMLKWQDTSINDYIMLPGQFSDGTIRFIALATLLLQPKKTMPSVIIIDEPELGLHPFAISQLAEMIKEAAINTQVIIATQSPGLVDEFEANQITVIERDEESESTIARKLDEQELAEWMENYSLSELWNKNVLGGRP
jgi:predicted ATPase